MLFHIYRQKEVKEKLRTAIPEWDLLGSSLSELAPLFIPIINPSLGRYIYISSAIMMKVLSFFFSIETKYWGKKKNIHILAFLLFGADFILASC